MAIAFVGGDTNGGNSDAPSITHGLTISSGDVIQVYLHWNDAVTALNAPDESWDSTFVSKGPAGHSHSYAIYTTFAGASEPASYGFNLAGTEQWTVGIRQYSGGDATFWDTEPSSATMNTGNSNTTVVGNNINVTASAMGV